MSTNSVFPNAIPDPLDPNYGPSADNIPVPSSTPGVPVTIASITNSDAVVVYNVANNFIKQPTTGAGYTFRFTFNGSFTGATLASGGNITIFAQLYHTDTTTDLIASQTVYVANSSAALSSYYSLSGIFIPLVGDVIKIYIQNNTGGTITNITLAPSSKGCGVELVSKASAPQLIFS